MKVQPNPIYFHTREMVCGGGTDKKKSTHFFSLTITRGIKPTVTRENQIFPQLPLLHLPPEAFYFLRSRLCVRVCAAIYKSHFVRSIKRSRSFVSVLDSLRFSSKVFLLVRSQASFVLFDFLARKNVSASPSLLSF